MSLRTIEAWIVLPREKYRLFKAGNAVTHHVEWLIPIIPGLVDMPVACTWRFRWAEEQRGSRMHKLGMAA